MPAKLIKITWPTYVETNIFLPVAETTNMEGCRQLLSLFHLDTSHPIASNSLHHPAFLTRTQCTEILYGHRRYIFEEFKPGPNIPRDMASLVSRKATVKWKSTPAIKIHWKWVRSPSGSFKLLGLLAVKWRGIIPLPQIGKKKKHLCKHPKKWFQKPVVAKVIILAWLSHILITRARTFI